MASCIKLYDPVIDANAENKYVVSGRITDVEGWQEVGISLSAPIDAPKNIPVTGCQVNILDDQGNAFPLKNSVRDNTMYGWAGNHFKQVLPTR